MREKICTVPCSESSFIPQGVVIDSFAMYIKGEKISAAVIEVPAKYLATSTAKGALKTVVSACTFATSVEYPMANMSNYRISLNEGDVAVFVSNKFGRFSRNARQVICAYEAAKAAATYWEVYNASKNATFISSLGVEETAMSYLSTWGFHSWTVFGALKKLNALSTKESKRFYRYAKRQGNRAALGNGAELIDVNDLNVLDALTA